VKLELSTHLSATAAHPVCAPLSVSLSSVAEEEDSEMEGEVMVKD
jgi:hypothetical protein